MSINFKKITDVPVIEKISEGDTLLVNSNGAAKQIDASKIGGGNDGCGAGSTVTTYVLNKTGNEIQDEGGFAFDGMRTHFLIVEGDFDGSQLIGTSYTFIADEENPESVTAMVDGSNYRYEERNGLKYEYLDGNLCVLEAGHYNTGEWGMTISKPGIYFYSDNMRLHMIKEITLSTVTQIDEKYIPRTIARTSQIPHPDWDTYYDFETSYIKGRTHYYKHPSMPESTVTYLYDAEEYEFEHPTHGTRFNNIMFENNEGNGHQFEDDVEYVAIMMLDDWEEVEVKFTLSSGFTTINVPYNEENVPLRIYSGYYEDEIDGATLPSTGSFIEYPGDHIRMIKAWSAPIVEKHLDDAFLSSNIQRVGGDVIINSSTEGSTKKFKITVDDNGNLTATEVE